MKVDMLGLYCLLAMARFELGFTEWPTPDLEAELEGRASRESALLPMEERALRHVRAEELEWTELAIGPLILLLVETAGEAWMGEALHHAVHLLAATEAKLSWELHTNGITHLQVDRTHDLRTLLTAGFPAGYSLL